MKDTIKLLFKMLRDLVYIAFLLYFGYTAVRLIWKGWQCTHEVHADQGQTLHAPHAGEAVAYSSELKIWQQWAEQHQTCVTGIQKGDWCRTFITWKHAFHTNIYEVDCLNTGETEDRVKKSMQMIIGTLRPSGVEVVTMNMERGDSRHFDAIGCLATGYLQ